MKLNTFDLIIIGGGVVGLSTAFHAIKTGKKVLLLEQFDFFHDRSASAGLARMFRLQYNEKIMTQLMQDSLPFWNELQQHSSEKLLHSVGCLWFGDPAIENSIGQMDTVIHLMNKMNIPYHSVTATDLVSFNHLPQHLTGFIQPDGAVINVKAVLQALHHACSTSQNVTLMSQQKVIGLESTHENIFVKTQNNIFSTEKLFISAGPYTNEMLRLLGFQWDITLWEMVAAYFKKKDSDTTYPMWLNYAEANGDDPGLYYGFPELAFDHPGYVRVAANFPAKAYRSMQEYHYVPDAKILKLIAKWVREHMSGLDPEPHFPFTCVNPLFLKKDGETLQQEFIVDFAPDSIPNHRNILIQATGHVFKLAPLLGKICVDLIMTGNTTFDRSCTAYRSGD